MLNHEYVSDFSLGVFSLLTNVYCFEVPHIQVLDNYVLQNCECLTIHNFASLYAHNFEISKL